jgi:hypothetical protein
MSGLYIAGYGYRSGEEIEIDRACKKHDSDLVFKRHPKTGHLTIFQRLMRDSVYVKNADAADLVDGDLFPLRSYPNRIPSTDEVEKWLYESDRERGDLLEKVQRHNRKVRESMDADVKAQARERAVFLEHGFRMLGHDTGRSVSTSNSGKRRRSFG